MTPPTAAPVAPPPKRRKPAAATTKKRNPHASSQTRSRPQRRTSGPAAGRAAAHKRPSASAAAPPRATKPRARTAAPAAAPVVQRLIHGRSGAILDQLLRGRACVGLVFVLLVGIVFFNVALLQLNEGIAQTNAKATALEQENAKLRRDLAPLASSERIQREAVERGYSLPAAGDVGYVRGDTGANAKRAAERMTAPGMGEGTASRPAALVEQQENASATATGTETPAAPTTPTTATTPDPATPQPAITPQSSDPQSGSPTPTAPTAAPVP